MGCSGSRPQTGPPANAHSSTTTDVSTSSSQAWLAGSSRQTCVLRTSRTYLRFDRKERQMCRWLAYSGSPILLKEMLYGGTNSLVDQSLHSRLGAEPTNGDGFGVGWYGDAAAGPGVFHSIEPAWNDQNLREIAGHISSSL